MPGVKIGNRNMRNKNTKTKIKAKPARPQSTRNSRSVGEMVSVSNKTGPRVPRTVMSNGATVVSHTETFGTNITGSSTFALENTWALQPAISTYSRGEPMGVWLPQIAQNFDNYEIESLKFKYRTACSTLTPGLVIFAYEPNPEGTPPTTYQDMRNMYSVDASVHSNLVFDVSARCKGRKLTRRSNVVNLPTYDVGKVYLATIGVTDAALCGFVDVEYKIKLSNPQSSTSAPVAPPALAVAAVPKQRWSVDASGFGSVNCAADSIGYVSTIFAQAGASTGASLASVVTKSIAAGNHTVEVSNKFVNPVIGSCRVLQFAAAGRYRLKFIPRLDWEDLKLFSLGLFSINTSEASLGAVEQIYTDISGGSTSTMTCNILANRGFTGTAIGDPNPGTDIFPEYTWTFAALTAGAQFLVKIGVISYNDVSTTTATIQGRTGMGLTKFELEYLGPLI